MAGMAATASIAKSAANNINFFNLPTSLYSRGTVFYRRRILLHKGPPPTTSDCSSTTTSRLAVATSRRGLVDLLVARRRVRAAYVDRRADLLKLKVIGLAGVLDDGQQVLGVARVRHTLDIGALVRVVALLGGREVLVNIGALAFLLALLCHLRDGGDGGHGQHRKERRQQHKLLQLTYLLLPSTRHGLQGLALMSLILSNRSKHCATLLRISKVANLFQSRARTCIVFYRVLGYFTSSYRALNTSYRAFSRLIKQ